MPFFQICDTRGFVCAADVRSVSYINIAYRGSDRFIPYVYWWLIFRCTNCFPCFEFFFKIFSWMSLSVCLSLGAYTYQIDCFERLVQNGNNVRYSYELPDFCPLNSPDLSTFISKYGAASLLEKIQDVDELRHVDCDWCVSWSVTERYWRQHWSVEQTSSCLHSSHRKTFLIVIVT